MVGEIRDPAGNPALSRFRRRPLRSAARHPLSHPDHGGDLGSGRGTLAARHRQWRGDILPPLHHGDRLPLRAQAPGDRGRQGLQGRDLFHRPLAASGGQSRRQARRGDRHRVVRDPGDPVDRRAGGASDRVPAHRELCASRPQWPSVGGSRGVAGKRPRRLPRAGPLVDDRRAVAAGNGRELAVERCRAPRTLRAGLGRRRPRPDPDPGLGGSGRRGRGQCTASPN